MKLNDPQRLATLTATGLLDSEPEESFDRLTRLAARLTGSPIAAVSLVDDQRQFFKSCIGLSGWAEKGTPLSHSFCQYAVITGEPLIVDDARAHPVLKDNLAVPDLDVIAYAGIPLLAPNGEALGSFCAIDTKPRHWTDDEIAVLKDLAASAATEIELRLDLQERLRVESALRAAEKAKDEFVSIVSHELRTPLTSLRGSLGLMSSGRLNQEQMQRMLDLAVSNTDRLIRLINDFLDLERIKSGRIDLDLRKIDLATVVDSAVQNVAPDALRRRIPIEPHVTNDTVFVDPDRIVQVIVNLLSNAVKFSQPETAVVLTAKKEGKEVVITVKDTGRGIPEDKLESIFEPFQQVDASDSRDKGGTGLGLPICKTIVEQHHGCIELQSSLGNGATFTVRIPQ